MGYRWTITTLGTGDGSDMKCNFCGAELTGRDKVKYCSLKCMHAERVRVSAARRTRICKQCGKAFIAPHPNGSAMRGEQQFGIFCSKACRGKWRSKTRTKNPACKVYFKSCVVCGNIFTAHNKRSNACPGECLIEWNRRYYGGLRPRLDNCLECGKTIIRDSANQKRFFCGARCRGLFGKGRKSGFDITLIAVDNPEIAEAYRALRNARRAINDKYQGRKTDV